MSEKELVTIIMPVYNAEKTLDKAVTSALNQTYKDIEIVIVNDCSSDSTLDVASKYLSERVRIIDNSINSGTYYSRNCGILKASGKYLTFLDADDFLDSNHIEVLHKEYNKLKDVDYYEGTTLRSPKNKVKMVFSGSRSFGIDDNYVFTEADKKSISIRKREEPLRYGPYAGTALHARIEASSFFEKKLTEEFGYFDSVRFAADSEFIGRVNLTYGPQEAWVPEARITYNVGVSSSSLTRGGGTGMSSKARLIYYKSFKAWHDRMKDVKKIIKDDA